MTGASAFSGDSRCTVMKIFTVLILIYLVYMVTTCPCRKFLCCHLPIFYGLLCALIIAAILENGFTLGCPKSPSP